MRFQLKEQGRARLAATSVAAISMALAVIAAAPAAAQDATWVGGTPGPANSNYFASQNWTPGTPSGTATFGASANTNISIGSVASLNGWTFSPGASDYTFTIDIPGVVYFNGAGITVNGGSARAISA